MDEERFDEVIRELPESFNAPPPPPLDEMWSVIEDAHFNAPVAKATSRGSFSTTSWLAAATLLVGIGIGALIPRVKAPAVTQSPVAQTTAPARDTSAVADAYRDQTHQYLGQAEIGRASCRERVWISVVAAALQRTKKGFRSVSGESSVRAA